MLLIAGTVAGLLSRKWTWVLAAGAAGLVGLALWMLQLLSTEHTTADLLSPATDGIPNLITFAADALVVVGGSMGTRARSIHHE
jgi:hypothetical protein